MAQLPDPVGAGEIKARQLHAQLVEFASQFRFFALEQGQPGAFRVIGLQAAFYFAGDRDASVAQVDLAVGEFAQLRGEGLR